MDALQCFKQCGLISNKEDHALEHPMYSERAICATCLGALIVLRDLDVRAPRDSRDEKEINKSERQLKQRLQRVMPPHASLLLSSLSLSLARSRAKSRDQIRASASCNTTSCDSLRDGSHDIDLA
jgi:hypothetical protein